MFERFTSDAREVVVGAQREARALDHGWIGTEHLLLAVLAGDGSPVRTTLEGLGVTYAGTRAQVLLQLTDQVTGKDTGDEAAALRDLGIDLDEVRRRVETSFGPGALDDAVLPRPRRWFRRRRHPAASGSCRRGRAGSHLSFTPRSKAALELALRESVRMRSGEITAAHLVLGVLRTEGVAARVFTLLGVRPDDVRRALLDQMGRAA